MTLLPTFSQHHNDDVCAPHAAVASRH